MINTFRSLGSCHFVLVSAKDRGVIILIMLLNIVVLSSQAQQRILFIGNSLTYYNDLPGLVGKIARQDGVKLVIKSFSKPNYALEDHWIEQQAAAEIKKDRYDYIVLQQGPSALLESRVNLLEYATFFARAARAQGSKVAFYMVWPSSNRSFDFQGVIDSYTQAADSVGGILCPVGKAWLKVWEEKKDFPLYDTDGFHPSEKASLLAAMIIYGKLMKRTDLEFVKPAKLGLQPLSEEEFSILKAVAGAVLSTR
jgi:hypothetical protein